jgi:hypothetical protein
MVINPGAIFDRLAAAMPSSPIRFRGPINELLGRNYDDDGHLFGGVGDALKLRRGLACNRRTSGYPSLAVQCPRSLAVFPPRGHR